LPDGRSLALLWALIEVESFGVSPGLVAVELVASALGEVALGIRLRVEEVDVQPDASIGALD
jgi:hypothetical protein